MLNKQIPENRTHRTELKWEVTYDVNFKYDQNPNKTLSSLYEDISKDKVTTFNKLIINFKLNSELMRDDDNLKLNILKMEKITFKECDFLGENFKKNLTQRITFTNCMFNKVHFGYSNLLNVIFNNCTFKECSFGISTFTKCIFDYNCKYDNNSIGNKIEFNDTLILSSRFISGYYSNETNIEYLNSISKSREEEAFREKNTLLKLSKKIFNSTKNADDDHLYYDALKTYSLSKINKRSAEKLYKIKQTKNEILKNSINIKFFIYQIKIILLFILYASIKLEYLILEILGYINDWGSNSIKCLFFGVLFILIFSIIYYLFFNICISKAIIQSIDITLIAGYTKHIQSSSEIKLQIIAICNLIIGLTWYAIMIPTLINKIGSSRL